MKTSLLAASFLILLCCPRMLLACSCFGSPSPCGSFGSAEAVFVGTVTRVESELVKFENTNDYISSDEPFPAVYYPGVVDKEKATVLTFASGDKFEGLDIHIPSQRPRRSIEGKLLFSDGRPVSGTFVEFRADTETAGQEGEANTTDAEGRFSLQVLEGLKGTLRGHMLSVSDEYENCPQLDKLIAAHTDIETKRIKVETNRDYRDLELVFPFPSCAKAKPRK